jgi:DNA polymerase-3 subunit gamma/tau
MGSMKDQIKANLAPQEHNPAPQESKGSTRAPRVDSGAPPESSNHPGSAGTPIPEHLQSPAPATAPAPAPPGPALSGEALWQATNEEFSKKYPLQAGYAAEMQFLSANAKSILLGAPADQRIAMQSLERPSIRSAIEDILTKFAGRKVLVKFELREDLQSHELVIEGNSPQTSTPDSSDSAPASSSNAAAVSPPPPLAIDEAEFQNDPLIKEALRLFEARITKKIQ